MATRKTKEKLYLDFPIDTSQIDIERVANFLIWCAKNFPYRYIPIEHMVRVAYAMPKPPRSYDARIELFKKKSIGRIRNLLLNKYKLGLDSKRTLGYRVTVDDEDKVRTCESKVAGQLISIKKRFGGIRGIVDESKIKDRSVKQLHESYGTVYKGLGNVIKRLPASTATTPADSKKKK